MLCVQILTQALNYQGGLQTIKLWPQTTPACWKHGLLHYELVRRLHFTYIQCMTALVNFVLGSRNLLGWAWPSPTLDVVHWNLVWCHSVTFSQVSLGLWVRHADHSYLTSSSPFSKGGSLPLSPAMLLFLVLLCSLVLWRSISLPLHRTFVLPLLAYSEFTSSLQLVHL